MKITDRLKVEHGIFLQQLDVLERLLEQGADSAALRASVETIAAAEERHAEIEEGVLWPAVKNAYGRDFTPVVQTADAHARIAALVARIRQGPFSADTVAQFIAELRQHLEDEIHGAFRVVEELLSEEDLTRLSDWDAEHVYAAAGKWETWKERWGRMAVPASRG